MFERFDLLDVAPRDRPATLDEVARLASVPFRAGAVDPAKPIEFVHGSSFVDDVNLTETTFANWRGTRSVRQAHDSSQPRLVLTLGIGSAPLRLEQHGRQVVGRRSSLLPLWSIAPWAMRADESQTARAVTVPLEAIGLPHLLLRDVLARDLGASPIGSLFAHHVAGVIRLRLRSRAETAAVARVTVELLRTLLSTAAGDEFRSRTPLRRTLGTRIMLYVKANLTDPTLSADSVAAAFGISRRYLFVVMRQLDLSLAEVVRRGRLQHAAAALEDPANFHVSVWAIAKASGFSDQSSFSRAFKAEYGCTPTEWRRTASGEQEPPRGAADPSAPPAWSDVHAMHNTVHDW